MRRHRAVSLFSFPSPFPRAPAPRRLLARGHGSASARPRVLACFSLQSSRTPSLAARTDLIAASSQRRTLSTFSSLRKRPPRPPTICPLRSPWRSPITPFCRRWCCQWARAWPSLATCTARCTRCCASWLRCAKWPPRTAAAPCWAKILSSPTRPFTSSCAAILSTAASTGPSSSH